MDSEIRNELFTLLREVNDAETMKDSQLRDCIDELEEALQAAVPTVQAAAGDDLDAMLNNIHPNATASLQFIQPYLTTDPEPYWQAHVSVPTGGLTGFQKHRGTGPTRMEAIQDAVRQAKGAEGDE